MTIQQNQILRLHARTTSRSSLPLVEGESLAAVFRAPRACIMCFLLLLQVALGTVHDIRSSSRVDGPDIAFLTRASKIALRETLLTHLPPFERFDVELLALDTPFHRAFLETCTTYSLPFWLRVDNLRFLTHLAISFRSVVLEAVHALFCPFWLLRGNRRRARQTHFCA